MHSIYTKLSYLTAFTLLLSCSKQDQVNPRPGSRENLTTSGASSTAATAGKVKEVNYFYKGERLTVQTVSNAESSSMLDGKDSKKVKEAMEVPTLVTYLTSADTSVIYLFDTREEFEKVANKGKKFATERPMKKPVSGDVTAKSQYGCSPSGPPSPAILLEEITFYEHDNYQGNLWMPNYTTVGFNTRCNSYGAWGTLTGFTAGYDANGERILDNWSDRISSLYIYVTTESDPIYDYDPHLGKRVGLYQDEWGEGRSLIVDVGRGQSRSVSRLSDIKYGSWNNSNWNDKISSVLIEPYF